MIVLGQASRPGGVQQKIFKSDNDPKKPIFSFYNGWTFSDQPINHLGLENVTVQYVMALNSIFFTHPLVFRQSTSSS